MYMGAHDDANEENTYVYSVNNMYFEKLHNVKVKDIGVHVCQTL